MNKKKVKKAFSLLLGLFLFKRNDARNPSFFVIFFFFFGSLSVCNFVNKCMRTGGLSPEEKGRKGHRRR